MYHGKNEDHSKKDHAKLVRAKSENDLIAAALEMNRAAHHAPIHHLKRSHNVSDLRPDSVLKDALKTIPGAVKEMLEEIKDDPSNKAQKIGTRFIGLANKLLDAAAGYVKNHKDISPEVKSLIDVAVIAIKKALEFVINKICNFIDRKLDEHSAKAKDKITHDKDHVKPPAHEIEEVRTHKHKKPKHK